MYLTVFSPTYAFREVIHLNKINLFTNSRCKQLLIACCQINTRFLDFSCRITDIKCIITMDYFVRYVE